MVLLRLADPRGSALTVPVHACTAYELVLNLLVVPVHMYCCTIACTVVDSLDAPVSHTSILYLCTKFVMNLPHTDRTTPYTDLIRSIVTVVADHPDYPGGSSWPIMADHGRT